MFVKEDAFFPHVSFPSVGNNRTARKTTHRDEHYVFNNYTTRVLYETFEMATCTRDLGPAVNCDDPVARSFAGLHNVDHLNTEIINGVYEASQGRFRIGRQSQLELTSIMRSVYSNEARHLPGDVAGQVASLNASVLAYAIPQIVSEAEMHAYYMWDREQEHRAPIPRFQANSGQTERTETAAQPRPFFVPSP
jgi:hypothetical protein